MPKRLKKENKALISDIFGNLREWGQVLELLERPGYSGVENPLYKQKNVIMLLGEAKDTLDSLIKGISAYSGKA